MNNAIIKKIIVVSMFIASLNAMKEKGSTLEEQKKPMRQNSFLRIHSQQTKHDSKPEGCYQCCYFNDCCVPFYYILTCLIGPNGQDSVGCYCCPKDDETSF